MEKPLEKIRVLDLSHFLSGSYCTMLLGAMGAEVIKLERPGVGDPARATPPFGGGVNGLSTELQTQEDLSLAILKRGRNKKSITLDLNSVEGKALFLKMIPHFDMVVENFRPGTMKKLGLSYEELKKVEPRIIYGSISGFGDVKAYSSYPAFDIVIQAMSGLMSTNGSMDTPPTRTSLAVSDQAAGLFLCVGLLAALEARRYTGVGQKVEASMLDSVVSMLMDEALDYWSAQGRPPRSGSRLPNLTPFNAYNAADGMYVIASGSDRHWQTIANVIGKPELAEDERYKSVPSRVQNADEVDAYINAWSEKLPVKTVVESLRRVGIPTAEVRSVPEMLADPNLIEAGVVGKIYHPTAGALENVSAARNPIRFNELGSDFDTPAPILGSYNETFYTKEIGLSEQEVSALKQSGII